MLEPTRRAERALDAAFRELTGEARGTPCALDVLGRRVEVEEAARGVARSGFDALCGKPLGPADYLALADELLGRLDLRDAQRALRPRLQETLATNGAAAG